MDQSLVRRPASGVDVLEDPQKLFDRGREISDALVRGVEGAYDLFFREAIPYGYRVAEAKPWTASDYSKYSDTDETLALGKFLRAAFSTKAAYKTASQQAAIVTWLVADRRSYEDVRGTGFRYLLKWAYYAKYLPRRKRTDLLRLASEYSRSSHNLEEYEALVEEAAKGLHVEARRKKTLVGSESAAQDLDDFDRETSDDPRPLLDRVMERARSSEFADFGQDERRLLLYSSCYAHFERTEPLLCQAGFYGLIDHLLLGLMRERIEQGEGNRAEIELFAKIFKEWQ